MKLIKKTIAVSQYDDAPRSQKNLFHGGCRSCIQRSGKPGQLGKHHQEDLYTNDSEDSQLQQAQLGQGQIFSKNQKARE